MSYPIEIKNIKYRLPGLSPSETANMVIVIKSSCPEWLFGYSRAELLSKAKST
jgi:hypothetical protein